MKKKRIQENTWEFQKHGRVDTSTSLIERERRGGCDSVISSRRATAEQIPQQRQWSRLRKPSIQRRSDTSASILTSGIRKLVTGTHTGPLGPLTRFTTLSLQRVRRVEIRNDAKCPVRIATLPFISILIAHQNKRSAISFSCLQRRLSLLQKKRRRRLFSPLIPHCFEWISTIASTLSNNTLASGMNWLLFQEALQAAFQKRSIHYTSFQKKDTAVLSPSGTPSGFWKQQVGGRP